MKRIAPASNCEKERSEVTQKKRKKVDTSKCRHYVCRGCTLSDSGDYVCKECNVKIMENGLNKNFHIIRQIGFSLDIKKNQELVIYDYPIQQNHALTIKSMCMDCKKIFEKEVESDGDITDLFINAFNKTCNTMKIEKKGVVIDKIQ